MPKSLARMTARSVVLSVMLGAHPARAGAGELIRLTGDFGIKETTLRAALTRMVGAGDLIRSADGYRLSDRLLARQRRQDHAMRPALRPWHGNWTTLVVTSVGADPRTRAMLRTSLQHKRFGELREGVWMRPDNLRPDLDAGIRDLARVVRVRDDDPAELARRLWDLSAWARAGRQLLRDMSSAPDVPTRFVTAAAMIRLLLTDPVLPDELLPAEWPGTRLRDAYNGFAAELMARSEDIRLVEAT